jgi:hypothetical protein
VEGIGGIGEGKGRDGKGREGKGRERTGRVGKRRENVTGCKEEKDWIG